MAADFSTLKQRVEDRLIDSNSVVTGEVGAWVNSAIRHLEEASTFPAMRAETEHTTDSTASDGGRKLSDLPGGWKEARGRPYLRVGQDGAEGTDPIDWAPSKDWLFAEGFNVDDTDETGQPRYLLAEQVAAGDEDIWVFPLPDGSSQWDDGEYRIVIPYYRFLPELSADSDTNFFTDNAEWYIVFKAVAFGFWADWQEERAIVWERLATEEQRRLVRFVNRSRVRRNLTLTPHLGAARHADPSA